MLELAACQAMVEAARVSSGAVLAALDRTIRDLAPNADAILIFEAQADELRCVYASGIRAEYFAGARLRRDRDDSLPARAAACGHRVSLGDVAPVIPTDRAALAIPMSSDPSSPVVYLSSSTASDIGNADGIALAVSFAATPFELALEREMDRTCATYDALTGLLTPRAFRDCLQAEVAKAALARASSLALWFIDTDNFKQVNDSQGHAAGDMVLQRVATLLRRHASGPNDLVARNGGDEFCAVVHGLEKIAGIHRAQQFCEAVRACDFGAGIPITASVGVAVFPYDAPDAAELLEAGDAAMYHSKNSGRDRVSYIVAPGTFAAYR